MAEELSLMRSRRPYLLKPYYDWLVDSGRTPYLLVEVVDKHVKVPEHHIADDEIVLNINPNAVKDLSFENEWLSFNATFGGVPYSIEVPFYAVRGIFDKESQNEGMFFDSVDDADEKSPSAEAKSQGFTKLK